ncbi:hypothetical protein HYN48_13260 [Flavobacterium magnum]|uniref:Leucine-rich repeat domain-containing protein n=1 Tax=Flavobacterium magnum TaxID=2162713 RepID=A0A2S0RIC4_9FLAO|nr:hypothetical protein [Flavobacterium magnum]AWA30968.1 hypothetical protein HYN48_13260 [Flavobacterium magnum]
MKLFLLFSLFILQGNVYCQEDLSLNNFDENFLKILINEKVFYNYENNKYEYIDENGDNLIQKSEAEKVTVLHLTKLKINTSSLKGIENFTNLEYLSFENLDITDLHLTKLNKLDALKFNNSKIVSIKLNDLKNLSYIEIGDNNLNLKEINLNQLIKIKKIVIGSNNLSLQKIDIKNIKTLSDFIIGGNNGKLKIINFKGVKNIINFSCINRETKIINFVPDSLKSLHCHYNLLQSIESKIKKNLKDLTLYSGNDKIKISDYNNLEYFNARNNDYFYDSEIKNISYLYFENLPNLQIVNCSDIHLNNLDFKNVNNLLSLDCSKNNLMSLPEINLKSINCSSNKLTTLPTQGMLNLESLDCSKNNFESINFDIFGNLKNINCSSNKLKKIDVNQLKKIEQLDCSSNNITKIHLEDLENLVYFNCRFNDSLKNLVLKNIYLKELLLSESVRYICVDNFFLNNIKFSASSPNLLINSDCNENSFEKTKIKIDLTTIENALIEFDNALQHEDIYKLKYICTREGFNEITPIKDLFFGKTLLENYNNGLFNIQNQNTLAIEINVDKYKVYYYFFKQLSEWKYFGLRNLSNFHKY